MRRLVPRAKIQPVWIKHAASLDLDARLVANICDEFPIIDAFTIIILSAEVGQGARADAGFLKEQRI